jgi:hypothetical protein
MFVSMMLTSQAHAGYWEARNVITGDIVAQVA